MTDKIQNWAFIAPKMSRDLSEYFEGILDYVRNNPLIFVHSFTFSDPHLAALPKMDGIISYAIPPPEVMRLFKGRHPPMIAITMRQPTIPTMAYAHIDPDGVANHVVELLIKRHCRSFAFCSSHAPFQTDESAALLRAYRRVLYARTGNMPRLFRPIQTLDANLIDSEVKRFTEWIAKMVKPCGMFVHGDDVARKMLDTCRLNGTQVPDALRVVGTGNSPLFCERTFPPLSSYAVDHKATATEAARRLELMLKGEMTPREASYEVPLPGVVERHSSIDERGAARIAHDAHTFITDHLRQGNSPSMREIAAYAAVSVRKLEQDFLCTYGHTIREEIADQRLERLSHALRESNESIKTLVARSGFGCMPSALIQFKKRFGMTMSEYRAQPDPGDFLTM